MAAILYQVILKILSYMVFFFMMKLHASASSL